MKRSIVLLNPALSCLTVVCLSALAMAVEPVPHSTKKNPTRLDVAPAKVELRGARAKQPLMVTAGFGAEGESDVTRLATYESLSPFVAVVTADGLVVPRGD